MKHLIAPVCTLLLLLSACKSGNSDAAGHGHDHDEIVTLSHTVWTEHSELFVEFKPLVVGNLTSFAAHFSDMSTFKPVASGSVTVSLVQGETGIRSVVDAPTQPGIFRPTIQPKAAGVYDLWFEIETAHYTDKIVIEQVEVFADEHAAMAANPPQPENGNAISFLKEQGWKIEWAIAPVVRDTVYEIIHASGEILPSQGDEIIVSATSNGIILFNLDNAFVGNSVSNGAALFTIRGGGLTNSNIETEYLQAKANFDQSKAAFDRKKQLYAANAIAKSEFEQATLAKELAESTFQNIGSSFGNGGKLVSAPTNGFLKNVLVSQGQYVSAGDPLAVIAKNQKLTLQAEVPPQHYAKLQHISDANFQPSGSDVVSSIADFNGKLLSFGKSVSRDEPFIPVRFEIDNQGDVLPGSFVSMFIKTRTRSTALVVPVPALMEHYGSHSVFVQTDGETFEKRDITIGVTDGKVVEVLSGLEEGEMVVTTGAYQVKMASMSSSVPAHGHAH